MPVGRSIQTFTMQILRHEKISEGKQKHNYHKTNSSNEARNLHYKNMETKFDNRLFVMCNAARCRKVKVYRAKVYFGAYRYMLSLIMILDALI